MFGQTKTGVSTQFLLVVYAGIVILSLIFHYEALVLTSRNVTQGVTIEANPLVSFFGTSNFFLFTWIGLIAIYVILWISPVPRHYAVIGAMAIAFIMAYDELHDFLMM